MLLPEDARALSLRDLWQQKYYLPFAYTTCI